MLQTLSPQKTKQAWSTGSQILSTYAGIETSGWKLGLLPSLENPELQKAIAKLAGEALVPNPFFELPILKSALNHLADKNVQFLYLSKQTGKEETLKFFAPITLSPIGIFRRKVLRTWNHLYAPLGMPLVCDNSSDETLKAFIECVKTAKYDEAKAIVFESLPKEGAFINDLYKSTALSDRLLLGIGTYRAGLKPVQNLNYEDTYFSGKRKQRLRKARSDLQALGTVEFHDFTDPKSITQPLEAFLELEQAGWKGKRKTALNDSISSALFCKDAVANSLAKEKCHICAVTLDGKTIASLISFKSNGYFYPWKITFDENYAKYSVGNLLTTFATNQFASKDCFKGLDSLAAEYNETTLRFWPDEKEFFTMIIGIGDDATQTALKITDELNRIKRIKVTLQRYLKTHPYFERLVSSLRM